MRANPSKKETKPQLCFVFFCFCFFAVVFLFNDSIPLEIPNQGRFLSNWCMAVSFFRGPRRMNSVILFVFLQNNQKRVTLKKHSHGCGAVKIGIRTNKKWWSNIYTHTLSHLRAPRPPPKKKGKTKTEMFAIRRSSTCFLSFGGSSSTQPVVMGVVRPSSIFGSCSWSRCYLRNQVENPPKKGVGQN